MSDDQPLDDAGKTALTEAFFRELIALVEQPRYNTIAYPGVIKGLLSLAATMMVNGARQTPAMLPVLLLHCEQLRDYVQTTVDGPGVPSPPTWH
jgi:hypothetical protein